MRIGSGIPGFYNAASKLNNLDAVNSISRVSDPAAASGERQQNSESAGYIAEHGGVIKTRISPENAYQKAKLETPRQIVEDMADKLMGKLPDILRDMKNLTEEETQATENRRVVVNERNAAAVAQKTAEDQTQMMNFSL